LFGSGLQHASKGFPVSRRNWKLVKPTSAVAALRLCKEFAAERANLSVERIADRMGVSHDSLYKWLSTGRLPAILLPTFEMVCGCHFTTEWLAASAGKLVIAMPTGKTATQTEMVALNTGFSAALQLLTDFYADRADPETTVAALTAHLTKVAWHHANVLQHAAPELDFNA